MMDDIGYASPHAVSIYRKNKTKGATKKFVRLWCGCQSGVLVRCLFFIIKSFKA